MPTTVVNMYKGEEYDVSIMRPGKWGNPFPASALLPRSRTESLRLYLEYMKRNDWLVQAARVELKDKVLGCCCKPKPCHGDILARIANGGEL